MMYGWFFKISILFHLNKSRKTVLKFSKKCVYNKKSLSTYKYYQPPFDIFRSSNSIQIAVSSKTLTKVFTSCYIYLQDLISVETESLNTATLQVPPVFSQLIDSSVCNIHLYLFSLQRNEL